MALVVRPDLILRQTYVSMAVMFAFDKVPEATDSLLSIDRKIAARSHDMLGETQMKVMPAQVVIEMVIMTGEAPRVTGVPRCHFRKYISMVLSLCNSHAAADLGQRDSLGVFSADDRFLYLASLLAHTLTERCFESVRWRRRKSGPTVPLRKLSMLRRSILGLQTNCAS
jgi:hypothetical protein